MPATDSPAAHARAITAGSSSSFAAALASRRASPGGAPPRAGGPSEPGVSALRDTLHTKRSTAAAGAPPPAPAEQPPPSSCRRGSGGQLPAAFSNTSTPATHADQRDSASSPPDAPSPSALRTVERCSSSQHACTPADTARAASASPPAALFIATNASTSTDPGTHAASSTRRGREPPPLLPLADGRLASSGWLPGSSTSSTLATVPPSAPSACARKSQRSAAAACPDGSPSPPASATVKQLLGSSHAGRRASWK
eukprot:364685-Chlamydomonas_euryale.AAC.3